MRKHTEHDISSFDMLLDTMCNTFGGIVFIALLIAIIAPSSNQQANSSLNNNENLKEVEQNIDLNRLTREQQDIKTGISHLQENLVKTNTFTSMPTNIMATLVASNILLHIEQNVLEMTNASLTATISTSLNSKETNNVTKSELNAQIKQLRDELRQKREQSTLTVRLPRVHVIKDKRPVFLAVKDGKFYAVSDVSVKQPFLERRNYDKEDVDIEKGPELSMGELRKNSGQLIKSGCEQTGKIAQALTTLNSETEFVLFAVYTNSFAEFNYIKALFVQHGFAYDWSPVNGAFTIISVEKVTAQ